MAKKETLLVYSTDSGAICPSCQKPVTSCSCLEAKKAQIKGDGNVRVRRETKGRGGKTVSTITGIPLNLSELEKLCTELKRRCGTGGSVKDGVIEIQGDHVATLLTELSKRNFSAKRSGG